MRTRTILLIVLAAAVLIAVIIVASVGTLTFATASNTDSPTVATGETVPFDTFGPASNITFTAPDTLVLGPQAGGTYTATVTMNVTNTTGAAVTNQFFLQVNGVSMAGLFAAIGVDPGATDTITVVFRDVVLPPGASIRLLNIGSTLELTDTVGGQSVPGVTLKLERTGP